MRKVFFMISLLALFSLTSCRPAAMPLPLTPGPSTNPASPVSTSATPLPGPVKTPATVASGIHVTVTIGPTCPGPQRPGQVCNRPYEAAFVVMNSRGEEAANFSTDQNGQATVDLPPGDYTVSPIVEGRFPVGTPMTVTVSAGQYVEVNLELDTGIR